MQSLTISFVAYIIASHAIAQVVSCWFTAEAWVCVNVVHVGFVVEEGAVGQDFL